MMEIVLLEQNVNTCGEGARAGEAAVVEARREDIAHAAGTLVGVHLGVVARVSSEDEEVFSGDIELDRADVAVRAEPFARTGVADPCRAEPQKRGIFDECRADRSVRHRGVLRACKVPGRPTLLEECHLVVRGSGERCELIVVCVVLKAWHIANENPVKSIKSE